jgi:hypothetical protein
VNGVATSREYSDSWISIQKLFDSQIQSLLIPQLSYSYHSVSTLLNTYEHIESFITKRPYLEPLHLDLMAQESGWRFGASFALLCILNLSCALDATILSVALPVGACPTQPLFLLSDTCLVQTIAVDLHGSVIEVFWAGTSVILTSTAF